MLRDDEARAGPAARRPEPMRARMPGRLAVGVMASATTLAAGMVAVSLLPGARLPVLVAGVAAGLTAWAAAGPLARIRPRLPRREAPAAPPPVSPPPPPPAAPAEMRALRHDLRGLLSPAMMMADRLLMSSEDPVARRCAEVVIASIERAERRLAQGEAVPPPEADPPGA